MRVRERETGLETGDTLITSSVFSSLYKPVITFFYFLTKALSFRKVQRVSTWKNTWKQLHSKSKI